MLAEAERFLRRGYVVIEPRKRKVDRKLDEGLRLQDGRALCLWNDPGWGRLVADGRSAGRFDDRLIRAMAEMITEWAPEPAPTWISYVPSLRHPELVPDLAARLAAALGLPVVPLVEKIRETRPQKGQWNSAHQETNVRGAFALTGGPRDEPLFLVDDTVDSRWTLTEVGALLRQHGAGELHPVVMASLQGRDS